jgi:hypothetical protein
VAGLLLPLAEIGGMFEAVYPSMLPMALRFGLTTQTAAQAFIAEITEASRERQGVGMPPLLVSAWKHKSASAGSLVDIDCQALRSANYRR